VLAEPQGHTTFTFCWQFERYFCDCSWECIQTFFHY